MIIDLYESLIYMDDPWDKVAIYRLVELTDEHYGIVLNHDISNSNLKKIPIREKDKLLIYPLSIFSSEKHNKLADKMLRIGDLACALLSKHRALKLEDLNKLIMARKENSELSEKQITWILRCLVAAKIILAKPNKNSIQFENSPIQKRREKHRKFSATIAVELEYLSERIKLIIDHGPTVGTYRENLLQNSLRKHLPERYHVATGFIFGAHTQIDILIYDRIDYAPIFREGDLVIVPPEAVRAAIEVKTNLTSENLESALGIINEIAHLDDNEPPFFKGIFSFDSSLNSEFLYEKISKFYTDLEAPAYGKPGEIICQPFQHMTCACINKKAFAHIRYVRNENNRLVPALYSKNSATELPSQSSFFIQSLLSHLKFGGVKQFKVDYMGRMLGEDSFERKIKDLIPEGDSWGAYFSFDEGDAEQDEVDRMEHLIITAQQWLDSEENFET
ncbi:TPA: DUF6602 domain-containing protein [Pseudomonas aeruginosa]|uniref:DUF6602 domain-containing protein n=1 Tax=Pseudomonas aeruginosa TaxID=287 RepID=UPI000F81F426|nr:DUF6602 domain-containing protein [Pseudomonas aeruginosa]MDV6568287.1 hypothetical protein [Pseudomonas aeruginosa]RTX47669.1 hypothetical protein DZA23_29750 [Pseudomonas aeruginosa]HCF9827720.1 hypothetical protein [Pseudomonas aeruginosa]HEQ0118018.1 hypothetical protein [Pseudomonas aeruginosa]HEQ0149813.1 hypothetical protein [Pseudomonas aeruginosa]